MRKGRSAINEEVTSHTPLRYLLAGYSLELHKLIRGTEVRGGGGGFL